MIKFKFPPTKEQRAVEKAQQQERLKDIENFEKQKLALEQQFALESEKDLFERERKKVTIKYNADKLSIENLKISEDQKNELLKLKKQEQFNALTEIDNQEALAEEERIKSFDELVDFRKVPLELKEKIKDNEPLRYSIKNDVDIYYNYVRKQLSELDDVGSEFKVIASQFQICYQKLASIMEDQEEIYNRIII